MAGLLKYGFTLSGDKNESDNDDRYGLIRESRRKNLSDLSTISRRNVSSFHDRQTAQVHSLAGIACLETPSPTHNFQNLIALWSSVIPETTPQWN